MGKPKILQLEEIELYNNTSGTNSSFDIQDDITDYEYIEIFFSYKGSANEFWNSVRVYSPLNKIVCLTCCEAVIRCLSYSHSICDL